MSETDYGLQLMDSIEEIEDLYHMGKIDKQRINGMLILVLCRQPRTPDEFKRRKSIIKRLDSLIDPVGRSKTFYG
jgi:hypothetical protein